LDTEGAIGGFVESFCQEKVQHIWPCVASGDLAKVDHVRCSRAAEWCVRQAPRNPLSPYVGIRLWTPRGAFPWRNICRQVSRAVECVGSVGRSLYVLQRPWRGW